MAEVLQGVVEDVMDGEIRSLCKMIYARVQSRELAYNEADVTDLRARIRTAISTWRTSDITPAGNPNL